MELARGAPFACACLDSCSKNSFVVPGQIPRVRLFGLISRRYCERFAMVTVIISPIFEFLLDPPTDLDSALWRDGDVPGVEQPVQVGAEQQAIFGAVGPGFGIGLDVGGFQGGQGALAGDGAAAGVGVGDQRAECALAKAAANQALRTVWFAFGV